MGTKKSVPSEKPVKPKKPVPTKEESVKVPVPCSVLTEERVREIAREETLRWEAEKIAFICQIDASAQKLLKGKEAIS